MNLSRNGLLRLGKFEGLVLTAYQDGEHHSIGFGSNDPSLKSGDTITVKEAFDRLKSDVAKREPIVGKALTVWVPQHVYDAVFLLFYQGGTDALAAVAKHINAGHWWPPHVEDELSKCAANEFLNQDTNAKGEHLAGLLKRRFAERRIFLFADYGDLGSVPFWRGNPRKTERQEYIVKEDDL